jgi:hypothetical protein
MVIAAAVGMMLRMTQQRMRKKRWKLGMSTSLPRCATGDAAKRSAGNSAAAVPARGAVDAGLTLLI